MTDYGTIKIPEAQFLKHNERRKDFGQTWAEYIDGQAPEGHDGTDEILGRIDDLEAALPRKVKEELGR